MLNHTQNRKHFTKITNILEKRVRIRRQNYFEDEDYLKIEPERVKNCPSNFLEIEVYY
jgi:hypothetical protein